MINPPDPVYNDPEAQRRRNMVLAMQSRFPRVRKTFMDRLREYLWIWFGYRGE